MQLLEGPGVYLTAEDVWRLRHGRADRELRAVLDLLERQYVADAGWRSSLVPLAEAAAALGVSHEAMRARCRRGCWPAELLSRRWWCVMPGTPAAPPSQP